jgi:prepilin-type N-terminal cleavage/methylation domain-containing protein
VKKFRRLAARGYTMIEILVSMTLLAIGAAGVMAMQKAAVQGHQDARQMDVANAIAREWMERLRRDAMMWTPDATKPGVVPPPNIAQAPTIQLATALVHPDHAHRAARSANRRREPGLRRARS